MSVQSASTNITSSKHLRWLWPSLVLAVGLLLGVSTGAIYQRVVERAEAMTALHALAYEPLIVNEFEDLDRFISHAAHRLLIEQSATPEQTSALFRHRQATSPFIQDMVILDPAGSILAMAWQGEAPDVSGRNYFTHHLETPDSSFFISPPQMSIVYEEDWFTSLSRALRDEQGELLGVAVGMLSLTQLRQNLEGLLIQDDLSVALMTQSGQLLFRLPDAPALGAGSDISHRAQIELPLKTAITQHLTGLDEQSRIVHFRPLAGHELIIAASVGRARALSNWYQAAGLGVAVWLVFALLSFLLIRRLRSSIQATESIQARFRRVVENASDLVVLSSAEGSLSYVSPNLKQHLGHEPQSVIGARVGAFLHPDDQEHIGKVLAAVVERGESLTGVEYRVRHADGSWRRQAASISPLFDGEGRLDVIIGIVRDVTDSHRARQKLTKMALADTLTGLPNRARLSSLLAGAMTEADRNGDKMALLFIDLDRFKPINDEHGHQVGDRILVLVAERIGQVLRKPDAAARFGGDEFLALLHGISGADDALAIARRIIEVINQPFQVDGLELSLSCSIGIALYPGHGDDERSLIMHADQAMYEAKQSGCSRAACYRGTEATDDAWDASSR